MYQKKSKRETEHSFFHFLGAQNTCAQNFDGARLSDLTEDQPIDKKNICWSERIEHMER